MNSSARTLCRSMPERYSQYADKTISDKVFKILKEKRNGFYIDLGASHPFVCSNTFKLFSEYGWTGILVEPNVHFIELLEKHRPDDILVKAAIWTENDELSFNTGEMGSALAVTGQKCNACYNCPMSVKTITLKTLLDEYSHIIPRQIDYLNVDIQYVEHLIYKDLPLAKVIAIEIHLKDFEEEILNYFRKKGYETEHLGHGDWLLVRMTFDERIKRWLKGIFAGSVSMARRVLERLISQEKSQSS